MTKKVTDAEFVKVLLTEEFCEMVDRAYMRLYEDSEGITEKQFAARVKSFKYKVDALKGRAKNTLHGEDMTFMWEI